VFFIAASVYVVGNSVFLLFGSGIEQAWNKFEDGHEPTSEVDGSARVVGKNVG
jgi:hypothetical protein